MHPNPGAAALPGPRAASLPHAARQARLVGPAPPRRAPGACRAAPRPGGEGAAAAGADGGAAAPQPQPDAAQQQPLKADPEAKFRRFGRHFGGRFWLSDLVDSAPRVRVRTSASRQRSELLELAVLNERLAGVVEPWEARARLEVLRNRRRAWDAVYDLVNESDVAATLDVIEAAAEKARGGRLGAGAAHGRRMRAHGGARGAHGGWAGVHARAWRRLVAGARQHSNSCSLRGPCTRRPTPQASELLSDDEQERTSVGDLRQQLVTLQEQVEAASEKLAATQARVDQNLRRVERLKREAAALERARGGASAAHAQEAPLAAAGAAAAVAAGATASATVSAGTSAAAATLERPAAPSGVAAAAATVAHASAARRRSRGLSSSMDAEPALKNFWYPCEFSSRLTPDKMVPFELFDEPWVLFRDEAGRPACVRDECAHRACPLSLGKVVGGEVRRPRGGTRGGVAWVGDRRRRLRLAGTPAPSCRVSSLAAHSLTVGPPLPTPAPQVECAYHGWRFNGSGDCTKMPSTVHCRGVHVAALPCVEKDGFVWVWPGEDEPGEVPATTLPPPGYDIHAEIAIDVPVEHGGCRCGPGARAGALRGGCAAKG
jgi:nitrite reductase/ring-hydroxylating ferredoxin subunit